VQLFLYHHEASKTYIPQSYSGRVMLFLAEEGKKPRAACPEGDWRKLAPDLEVHRIPCSHHTILRPPHLKTLVDKLRASAHQ
jgi:thioesterase domain-containing protein